METASSLQWSYPGTDKANPRSNLLFPLTIGMVSELRSWERSL